MSSTNRYLMLSAACLATAAALWYISQDKDEVEFDPDKHSVENLRKIIHEMIVENSTLYCQKLNLLRNLKSNGEFDENTV